MGQVIVTAAGMLCISAAGALSAGPVRIGYGEQPPMAFRTSNSKPAGFLVEVISEAARREGIPLEWRFDEGNGVEDALGRGRADLWPAAGDLPGRRALFYLSKPWWKIELTVLLRAGGPTSLENFGSHRLAYVRGLESLARRQLPHSIPVPEPNYVAAVTDLCQSRVDGVLIDRMALDQQLVERPAGCETAIFRTLNLPGVSVDLSVVALPEFRNIADRLRDRIDDLATDGTLGALAARYPPASSASADRLAATLRERYDRRLLLIGLLFASALLAASTWVIRRLHNDVLARKRAQEELEQSRTQLARAHRIAALGDWEADLVKRTAEWSQNARGILCMPDRTTGGWERLLECVAPEDRERVRSAFEHTIATGRPLDTDFWAAAPDRTRRFVRQHGEPTRDSSGEVLRLVGTVQDVTEYKRLEDQVRQSQKLESIGRLAGGVAHDFNNLLTVINGYADVLLVGMDENDPLYQPIAEIRKAGDRGATLTQQMLAFSRKQSGQPRPLDLNSVIVDAWNMLRRLVGEDIELVMQLEPSLGTANADPALLQQVLMNLVVNARDAMPDGGRVVVETANTEVEARFSGPAGDAKAGPHVVLSVTDTGVGMDPATQARIFEPFFTTKPSGSGTGLGLSMVYGIVHKSGGWITVESEPGAGSTFRVFLPRMQQQPAEADSAAAATILPDLKGTGTILVVEDEVEVRKLAASVLRAYGYELMEAGNGEEALSLLARHTGPLHLLISDVVMPGMSGRDLAIRVRQARPDVAVLFTSGYGDHLQEPAEGACGYLAKPFAPHALALKVREILGESSSSGGRMSPRRGA